ncbi:MAG: hypothetical protein JO335_09570 [Sphingomonas sp.]|nr:hypothetical protein [Sphingomonas sp.]
MRGKLQIISAVALAVSSVLASAAPQAAAPTGAAGTDGLAQDCEAHSFETAIRLTGADGKPHESKVHMCGTKGQSDADWVRTLQDAVKKTALSPQMPAAAKEQIIAAVNAEITRLSIPTLNLPAGTDIAKLPKAGTSPAQVAPLSRDYGSLGALPTATNVEPPHVLGPGATIAPVARVTIRCALPGDEGRPTECDTIDRDTVMVLRADDAYPRGVELRFLRHGDSRAELDLPALKEGQIASLRLPPAVCAGVVRSRVEIQALGANSPSGTVAGRIGEYDLRC